MTPRTALAPHPQSSERAGGQEPHSSYSAASDLLRQIKLHGGGLAPRTLELPTVLSHLVLPRRAVSLDRRGMPCTVFAVVSCISCKLNDHDKKKKKKGNRPRESCDLPTCGARPASFPKSACPASTRPLHTLSQRDNASSDPRQRPRRLPFHRALQSLVVPASQPRLL